MRFITFSGVDGSGKSTQLDLLRTKLEGEGKKVAYFHAVEFSLANRMVRSFKKDPRFTPGQEKAVTKASWCSIVLREKFLLIDMIRFIFLRRSLEREGYDYLLSDRSFFDSIVNLEYLAKQVHFFSWPINRWIDWLARYTPKGDTCFYFDLTPEIIMSRERAPEQGIDYLRDKMALFQQRIPSWKMITIDGSRSKEEIFQIINHNIAK